MSDTIGGGSGGSITIVLGDSVQLKESTARPPPRYDPRHLHRMVAHWKGVAAGRRDLEDDSARTALVRRLLAVAEAGGDPTETEDYRAWLGYKEKK